ncbi:MAG: hypothetical protein EOO28_27640 [Comamonadaceae bacterium]|nr:MAG: hypothetical protein EOO28_27640 [Comamonadaceae bacterium]
MVSNSSRTAMVSLFVQPSRLDQILEEFDQAGASFSACVVFSSDTVGTQGLNSFWGARVNLIFVLVANPDLVDYEAIAAILESEHLAPDDCIWIAADAGRSLVPQGCQRLDVDGAVLSISAPSLTLKQ